MKSPMIAGKKLVFAPVFAPASASLEGMLDLVPSARVAHIGLYRDPRTLVAVEYFFKAPDDIAERLVIVVHPDAGDRQFRGRRDRPAEGKRRASDMRIVCLLARRQAIEKHARHHPDVPIWTAAIDEELNEHGYIVPGLGDAGDRMYGTR